MSEPRNAARVFTEVPAATFKIKDLLQTKRFTNDFVRCNVTDSQEIPRVTSKIEKITTGYSENRINRKRSSGVFTAQTLGNATRGQLADWEKLVQKNGEKNSNQQGCKEPTINKRKMETSWRCPNCIT